MGWALVRCQSNVKSWFTEFQSLARPSSGFATPLRAVDLVGVYVKTGKEQVRQKNHVSSLYAVMCNCITQLWISPILSALNNTGLNHLLLLEKRHCITTADSWSCIERAEGSIVAGGWLSGNQAAATNLDGAGLIFTPPSSRSSPVRRRYYLRLEASCAWRVIPVPYCR